MTRQYLMQKYLPLLFLLVFAVPLFFHNIHSTHSPGGDDYAQYIKEAQNIANGKPYYQSNYVFNKYNNCYSPPQYPPGFPLMLAPVVKYWGIDIRPMCYFNTVIAACILFALFFYFRKYMSAFAACCLAIVISYSQCMMDLKQAVLSDASSMLFVLLYLIVRNAKSFSWQRILLLILLATLAILTRTQSVLLLFAEVALLGISILKTAAKEKKLSMKAISLAPLYIVMGTLLFSVVLNKIVFYCPTSATGFYIDFLRSTLQKGLPSIVRDNVTTLLGSITDFFHYDTDHGMRTALVTLMESAGLVFCCIGFLVSVTKRLCFDDLFFVFVCAMVLYYPIHDARYFFPVMPVVFYYCYVALARIVPMVTTVRPRYVALLLTFIYLFAGMKYLKATTLPPAGYVPEAKDQQAFNYIIAHVNDSDIIVCSRPRLVTLYTNKRCMIHAWQYPLDVNKKVFDSLHVRYLLLNGIVDDYYRTYMHQYEHPVDSVNIAPGYVLYTLR